MNNSNQTHTDCGKSHMAPRLQQGFTLVELMVAVVIALFLLGGVLTSVQSTRKAYGNQNLMAQLQDNERLAMSLLATTIETTGYFPQPQNNLSTVVFPSGGVFATNGQTVFGATGDTITVRYAAAQNDNVYGCTGYQNKLNAPYEVLLNTFKVAGNQLICTFKGVDYPLINSSVVAGVTTLGVQSMGIVYGVKSNAADTGSCTDTYLPAASMTAALWTTVCSVKITLTFINPMLPTTGPAIVISRVIAVMNTAGVNS
jgi:type IV pilus assembly protein PilW